MCLTNVYFFLDGTAKQWYVSHERTLNSWKTFRIGLRGLFDGRFMYTKRAEGQLQGLILEGEYVVLNLVH